MPRKAVFLDRDGVINEDVGYLSSPEQLNLLDGVPEALKLLASAGFLRIVVTNQSGIARGHFSEDDLARIHAELVRRLKDEGTGVDAIYYCPHLEEGPVPGYGRACEARKPGPGMLLAAAADLDLDLAESFLVGDTLTDIQAGGAAGCRTILIGDPAAAREYGADAAAADLLAAARLIVDWTRE